MLDKLQAFVRRRTALCGNICREDSAVSAKLAG